jgi:hypothetical protein
MPDCSIYCDADEAPSLSAVNAATSGTHFSRYEIEIMLAISTYCIYQMTGTNGNGIKSTHCLTPPTLHEGCHGMTIETPLPEEAGFFVPHERRPSRNC